jgi:hypothetical protein
LVGNRAAAEIGNAINCYLAKCVLVPDGNGILARIPDELIAEEGLLCRKLIDLRHCYPSKPWVLLIYAEYFSLRRVRQLNLIKSRNGGCGRALGEGGGAGGRADAIVCSGQPAGPT